MHRFVLMLISVGILTVALAPPVAAARQLPIQFSGIGTAAVDGCLEGGDPPCADVAMVAVSYTGSGSPFTEIKGSKNGTAVISGILQVWTDSHEADTGCYTTMLGRLVGSVGKNVREAFAFDVQGIFCPLGFAGTFEVDPSGTDLALFRGAAGSGTFQMDLLLDLSRLSSSPSSVAISGALTVRR